LRTVTTRTTAAKRGITATDPPFKKRKGMNMLTYDELLSVTLQGAKPRASLLEFVQEAVACTLKVEHVQYLVPIALIEGDGCDKFEGAYFGTVPLLQIPNSVWGEALPQIFESLGVKRSIVITLALTRRTGHKSSPEEREAAHKELLAAVAANDFSDGLSVLFIAEDKTSCLCAVLPFTVAKDGGVTFGEVGYSDSVDGGLSFMPHPKSRPN
jgi:hypothetical protein